MKILLSSYPFPPSVGGIEEASEIVALGLAAAGHPVKVVTRTPAAPAADGYPFEVVRQPSPITLLNCVRWCDVYLQMNVSLRFAWPLLLAPRPWVVALHAPFYGSKGLAGVKEFIKRITLLPARVTAVSEAMKKGTGRKTVVVTNPYRDDIFRVTGNEPRSYDLAFLGRLVSDKGAIVLLDAVAQLRLRGLKPRLIIIGRGPDESALRQRCAELRLDEQVEFAGFLPNAELARRLNKSKIMVVPSVWEEGFGIVALQGIACGCVVVGSDVGGLPEAIGDCGVTFPKGDVTALTDRLAELIQDERRIGALRACAPSHLARHRPKAVTEAYLAVLEEACGGIRRPPA